MIDDEVENLKACKDGMVKMLRVMNDYNLQLQSEVTSLFLPPVDISRVRLSR